ncbi:DHH family phosphoesterase [Shigella flexneri]
MAIIWLIKCAQHWNVRVSWKKNYNGLKNKLPRRRAQISSKAIDVNGVKLLVSELSGVEPKMLRTMVDDLKNQLGSTIIVLATVAEGKVSLIAGVSKDVTVCESRGTDWYGRSTGGRQGWWTS